MVHYQPWPVPDGGSSFAFFVIAIAITITYMYFSRQATPKR